ncbi:MAG: ribosome hibernation-promoting factor, HPF/YfiA family [Peptococcaceae bacterium]
MKINVKAKNTQVTEPLTDYIEKRFAKLEKYFVNADLTGTVTLVVEKGLHRVEATIPLNRYILRAEDSSNDMYASIDGVVDKLERQIRKYKTKINRKGKVQTINDLPPAQDAAPVAEEEGKIIKTKTFVVKPMDEEEAIMQMELLEHDFFVFLNAETNSINVVYKRKDNQYGLIQPTVD